MYQKQQQQHQQQVAMGLVNTGQSVHRDSKRKKATMRNADEKMVNVKHRKLSIPKFYKDIRGVYYE